RVRPVGREATELFAVRHLDGRQSTCQQVEVRAEDGAVLGVREAADVGGQMSVIDGLIDQQVAEGAGGRLRQADVVRLGERLFEQHEVGVRRVAGVAEAGRVGGEADVDDASAAAVRRETHQ